MKNVKPFQVWRTKTGELGFVCEDGCGDFALLWWDNIGKVWVTSLIDTQLDVLIKDQVALDSFLRMI